MKGLPSDLLELPALEGARVVALALLDRAAAAVKRLGAPDDPEALHDFRVGIRRLRSFFRAYRSQFDGRLPKKVRKRLRGLASATSAGRDAEVQLAWIGDNSTDLNPRQRRGARELAAAVEQRRDEAYAGAVADVTHEFSRVERQLRRRLTHPKAEPEAGQVAFGSVTAALVLEHVRELREALGEVEAPGDEEEAHRARIRAKRLRYLLEPLDGIVPPVHGLIRQLKELQDLLGELHDLHVLGEEITRAAQQAVTRRTEAVRIQARGGRRSARKAQEPGLLALLERLGRQEQELFERLRADWLGSAGARFLKDAGALERRLRSRKGLTEEIEHKFLLRGVPDEARQAAVVEIRQGWLPGEVLQERLRAERSADGERYYRTVKAGSGLRRLELEEEASKDLFDALWPLTEGRRVTKRRYRLAENGLVWEVDEFTDRELFLAEVEVPPESGSVEAPSWLAAQVVREVTGEPEYVNVNLAC